MLRTTAIAKELAAIERKMQETDNATLKEALKKKQTRLKAELKDPTQSTTKLATPPEVVTINTRFPLGKFCKAMSLVISNSSSKCSTRRAPH